MKLAFREIVYFHEWNNAGASKNAPGRVLGRGRFVVQRFHLQFDRFASRTNRFPSADRNDETTLNTVSLSPPMFRMSSRSGAWLEGPVMANLVEEMLADPTGDPIFSLVEGLGGELVDHVLFTSITVEPNSEVSAQILAPSARVTSSFI